MKYIKNYKEAQINNNANNENSKYLQIDSNNYFYSFIKVVYILLSIFFFLKLFKNMNQKYQKEENRNSEKFLDLDKYDINNFNNINNLSI